MLIIEPFFTCLHRFSPVKTVYSKKNLRKSPLSLNSLMFVWLAKCYIVAIASPRRPNSNSLIWYSCKL